MREHRKRTQTGHRVTSTLPSERIEFGLGQGLCAPTQVNVGLPTFTVLRLTYRHADLLQPCTRKSVVQHATFDGAGDARHAKIGRVENKIRSLSKFSVGSSYNGLRRRLRLSQPQEKPLVGLKLETIKGC